MLHRVMAIYQLACFNEPVLELLGYESCKISIRPSVATTEFMNEILLKMLDCDKHLMCCAILGYCFCQYHAMCRASPKLFEST